MYDRARIVPMGQVSWRFLGELAKYSVGPSLRIDCTMQEILDARSRWVDSQNSPDWVVHLPFFINFTLCPWYRTSTSENYLEHSWEQYDATKIKRYGDTYLCYCIYPLGVLRTDEQHNFDLLQRWHDIRLGSGYHEHEVPAAQTRGKE